MSTLISAAGDNAYELNSELVDNRAGWKLVSALTQCRVVYEANGSPHADKFHGTAHNKPFKDMTLELRDKFQTQGLPPYTQELRPKGIHAVAQPS